MVDAWSRHVQVKEKKVKGERRVLVAVERGTWQQGWDWEDGGRLVAAGAWNVVAGVGLERWGLFGSSRSVERGGRGRTGGDKSCLVAAEV